MRTIAMPYSGELLLSHLLAYGLLVVLDDAGVRGHIRHPPESLSCTPCIDVADDVSDDIVAAAVRATALAAEQVVEADLAPGRRGNERRSVIWARHSLGGDKEKASLVVARRAELVAQTTDRAVAGVLAGLGAPACWGPPHVEPAHGATPLDAVIGNIGSDLVRGVMRKGRTSASTLEAPDLWSVRPSRGSAQADLTGWAPKGTPAPLTHQWLAVIGLGLLPVAHRRLERSVIPGWWESDRPRRRGIALPLMPDATSLARLRAVVALRALTVVAAQRFDAIAAAAELRAVGAPELMLFERVARRQISSVAYSFQRGRRVALDG